MKTDFDAEIEGIAREIVETSSIAIRSRENAQALINFVYRLYHRATLTANSDEFRLTETAIQHAIQQIGPHPDLCFLMASLDFRFHRFQKVENDLNSRKVFNDSSQAKALRADIDFQKGRYAQAEIGYERLIADDRNWEYLARFANFKAKMGEFVEAERLYIEAEDELTAKQMRSYAWLEVQRGALGLARGSNADAWAHYSRAQEAYSGYWVVEKHIAELLNAEDRFEEAAKLYERILVSCSLPEIRQALGDVYVSMGKSEEAKACYNTALTEYLETVERGEVCYYHHLADFYSNAVRCRAEAVRWAKKDFELRGNFSTQAALAWAYYCDDQPAEAIIAITQALSSGVKDARIYFQASRIYLRAGQIEQSECYYKLAREINPECEKFSRHYTG